MELSRFETLLEHHLSGTQAPADAVAFEQLLQADAGLRRMLVDRLLLEVHLRKAFAGTIVPTPALPERPYRAWRLVGGLVAALVLLGCLAAWFRPVPRSIVVPVHQVVAGEIRIDGVAVKQLPEDKLIEVSGEVGAVIQLADGSEAELSPGSKALIHGKRAEARQSVELAQGAGKFKVTGEPGQFRVETVVGSVTTLGTEFSVKLQPRGKGEGKRASSRRKQVLTVAVTQGTVKVEVNGNSHLLHAGASKTFGEERSEDRREDDD